MISFLVALALAQPVSGCPNPNMTCNGVSSTRVNATTGNFGFVDAGTVSASTHVRSALGKFDLVDAGNVNVVGRTWTTLLDAGAAHVANNLGVAGTAKIEIADAGVLNVADQITTGGHIFCGDDLHVDTSDSVFLNGATRSVGVQYDGTNIRLLVATATVPSSANASNLGTSSLPFSDAFASVYHVGGTTKIADSSTAITVTACSGGTAASVTNVNGTAAVQFDVGTACTSESTAVLTFPSNTAGWRCSCDITTADRALVQRVMPSASATTVTMQHITISTGANTDFTDSADVACDCRGL